MQTSNTMRRRWTKVGIGIMALAIVIAVMLQVPDMVRMLLEEMGILRPSNPVAIYEDMVFSGRGTGWDHFSGMSTGGHLIEDDKDMAVADLFVVVGDRRPMLLRDFPEELAADVLPWRVFYDEEASRRLGDEDATRDVTYTRIPFFKTFFLLIAMES